MSTTEAPTAPRDLLELSDERKAELEAFDGLALERRRVELANGGLYSTLEDGQLAELAYVIALLRRSATPATPKRKRAKGAVTDDDLDVGVVTETLDDGDSDSGDEDLD